MFGYIQTDREELKVGEWEAYKGIYCSLCRQMGKDYGFLTRFSLSYDFTFYAMLRLARQEECQGFKIGRCVFHPAARCHVLKESGTAVSDAAAAAVILTYYSLRDRLSDRGWGSRIKAAIAYPAFALAHRKARKRYPELETLTAECMQAQKRAEEERAGLDGASDPTARLLAGLFTYRETDPKAIRVLSRFGYCMGKWIYLMDAWDDLEDDRVRNNYNPFLTAFAEVPANQWKDRAEGLLNMTMSEAASAMELAEYHRFRPILENVIYLGSVKRKKQVLYHESSQKGRKAAASTAATK